jgi:uncharacterized protein (DUF983 family)
MSTPTSTTAAVLALRCPRCHQGHLFSHPVYHVTRFAEMPEACPVCAQTFEPEPGFYFGAMFVSYVFSVAIFAITSVLLYYLAGDPALWVYITVVGLAATLLTPLALRYSRALMLFWFGGVHFQPGLARR